MGTGKRYGFFSFSGSEYFDFTVYFAYREKASACS